MEIYQGIERSPNPQAVEVKIRTFLNTIPVLPFTPAVAERCARVRETLRRQSKRVNARALDLIIAATAIEYGLTLVTRNIDDYTDVPDLDLCRDS
jgi:predicted nucleic acid-binding protein